MLKRIILTLALTTLASPLITAAAAACTNPTGTEGEQIYNSDHKTMQFCNGTNWISMSSAFVTGGGGGKPDAIIVDRKTSGTIGGASTANTWMIRDLNFEIRDPSDYISISSNTFVPSVNGWVEWSAPGQLLGLNRSRLYNVTDSTVAAYGITNYTWGEPDPAVGFGSVEGGKTYRIEHRSEQTRTNGLGNADSMGDYEYYTYVKFWAD